MTQQKLYPGIGKDEFGGMTDIGRIIRDAWVFRILAEAEDCAGWSYDRLNALYDQVHHAWEPYGHLFRNLPPELQARHQRIHGEALRLARQRGWNPVLDENAD